MLKSLFWTALRLVALTLLLVQVTLSSALAEDSPSSAEVNWQPSEVVETQSPEAINPGHVELSEPQEQMLDTSQVEVKNTPEESPTVSSSPSTSSRPFDPYDYDAMKKFYDELYGKGG